MTNPLKQLCLVYSGKMVGFQKVVIEPAPEGAYIFIYKTLDSKNPEIDYLQDDIADAKRFCFQELGLATNSWKPNKSIKRLMN